ncbi:MAG: DUF3473 domain-containing protein [Phycisphaeraceae bacterium]|nr:DUF3473 domain-containing protein [Phycisphaeraceae bacterium]
MTPAPTPPRPLAAMSIDVEDWFQVENLKSVVARDSWDQRELRVEANTDRMLQSMADRGIKATCFILGWVADKAPALVRRIAQAGHEIASHGYGHELIYSISHDAFRADIDRSTKALQDLTGAQIRGYRAPSFSITDWAIDILQEQGFEYDSSSFPVVAHDRYGKLSGIHAGVPIQELRPGFHEVCVSCLNLAGKGVPWGGGGYFRLIPYGLFRAGVRRILASGKPYVFYIHPWEIDAGQPRLTGMKRSHAFRHYVNLDRCGSRFDALLRDFEWTTVAHVLDASLAQAQPAPARVA